MFGNPKISATPVDDMYASQADLPANSFDNAMNFANMNPGSSMDSNLMTPSYTANYRPQYQGPTGGSYYGRPSFGQALGNLSPFGEDTYWGNPIDHNRQSIDALSQKPMDAMMWGAQNIVLPGLAFKGVASALKGLGGDHLLGGGQGLGQSLGRGLGRGLAAGFGAAEGGMIAKRLPTMLGGAAGLAGGLALPFLGVKAVMKLAEKTIVDPYINQRRSSEDLENNFRGVTFGDSEGHSLTGKGLSRHEAAGIAQQITRQGTSEMAFSSTQYAQGASMMARAGLMDNVKSKDISKRVKEGMEQVKLIMSIANMPEMKDAIEQLAKLQMAGASVVGGSQSEASHTMRQLGGMASIAGMSVSKLMNTVGAQGQYLYQSNGMTPYLGQLAAANTHASFAAGKRMGLLSEADEARMGGLEGATQASLTGQINASQTLYNKMSNYNKYLGGGDAGSQVGNITAYGQKLSRDPMGAYGATELYGRKMAGIQSKDRGSLSVDDQLKDVTRDAPWLKDNDGKISLERAVPYLQQMGMNVDQIHAWAVQRTHEQDSGAYAFKNRALDANLAENQRAYLGQTGAYSGGVLGASHDLKKFGRKMTNRVSSGIVDPLTSAVGSAGEWLERASDYFLHGDSLPKIKESGDIDDLLKTTSGTRAPKEFQELVLTDSEKYDRVKSSLKATGIAALSPVAGFTNGMEQYGKRDDTYTTSTIKDALNRGLGKGGAADAYFAIKDNKSKESKEALRKFISSDMRDTDAFDSAGKDFDKVFNHLNKTTKRQHAFDPNGPGVLRRTWDNLFDAVGFDTRTVEKNADKGTLDNALTEGSGLKTGGRLEKLAAVRAALELGQENISDLDTDDTLGRSSGLKKYMKATGMKDMREALKAGKEASLKGSTLISMSMGLQDLSKYSKEELDNDGEGALRRIAKEKGGPVFDQAMNVEGKDAKDIHGMQAFSIEMSAQKKKITQQYREGIVDFKGFQQTMNTLADKESTKEFKDAVGDFAKAVKDMPGSSSTSTPLSEYSITEWAKGLLTSRSAMEKNHREIKP